MRRGGFAGDYAPLREEVARCFAESFLSQASMIARAAISASCRMARPRLWRARRAPVRHGAHDKTGRAVLRQLPDRKRSADIIDRCAEYTEREAAANDGEQHGRFHAVNLLLVDVKLVGEVGHGNRPCNTRSPALSPSSYLVICIGAVTGVTQKPARSQRQSLLSGNPILRGRDKGPEMAPEI